MMKGARFYIIGDKPLSAWVGRAIADVTAATVGVCLLVVGEGGRGGRGRETDKIRWFQALTDKLNCFLSPFVHTCDDQPVGTALFPRVAVCVSGSVRGQRKSDTSRNRNVWLYQRLVNGDERQVWSAQAQRHART